MLVFKLLVIKVRFGPRFGDEELQNFAVALRVGEIALYFCHWACLNFAAKIKIISPRCHFRPFISPYFNIIYFCLYLNLCVLLLAHTPITSLSEQPLFQYSPQPKKMIPFSHPVAIQCNQQQMQQNQMQQNQLQATNQQFPIQFHQNQQQQQQMFPMQPNGQIQAATMQQNNMQAAGLQMQQSSQQNVMHYQHIVQIQQQKKIPINIQVSN